MAQRTGSERGRSSTPGRQQPQAAQTAETQARMQRQMRARLNTLRMGVTGCAALGGLACYALLAQFGVQPLIAGVIGLAFALLGRMALASFAHDWLFALARRQAERDISTDSPPPANPGRRPGRQ